MDNTLTEEEIIFLQGLYQIEDLRVLDYGNIINTYIDLLELYYSQNDDNFFDPDFFVLIHQGILYFLSCFFSEAITNPIPLQKVQSLYKQIDGSINLSFFSLTQLNQSYEKILSIGYLIITRLGEKAYHPAFQKSLSELAVCANYIYSYEHSVSKQKMLS